MKAWLVVPLALVVALAGTLRAQPPSEATLVAATQAAPRDGLEHLATRLCRQRVVLLGEADHGDARTWEIKADLVRLLVRDCGFDAVVFESGMYDFLALRPAYEAGTATRAALADAIGALWAGARRMQPLISELHAWSADGTVQVLGMDDQLHSTARFAQRQLPGVLARRLPAARAAGCEAAMRRQVTWGYDAAHPWDERARDELLGCLDEVQVRLRSAAFAVELAMAASLHRYLSRAFVHDAEARFNARDASMAANLAWQLDRLGPEARVIVWTAGIHAARSLESVAALRGRTSLAAGLRVSGIGPMASIGFTAASGASQPRGRPRISLVPAPPESLEARALAEGQALRYLGAGALAGFGTIAARPLGHHFHEARWDQVFDGLVVLREEIPAEHE